MIVLLWMWAVTFTACDKDHAANPNHLVTVSSLGGNGSLGFANGAGSEAQFWGPKGIIVDEITMFMLLPKIIPVIYGWAPRTDCPSFKKEES
ncbi:MAG: hypothetical protein WBB36_18245 [Chitinophagales bacterium]